jgi:hypothetical protein
MTREALQMVCVSQRADELSGQMALTLSAYPLLTTRSP